MFSLSLLTLQLLRSLRGASAELREDYAVCFGELGAIDPGK